MRNITRRLGLAWALASPLAMLASPASANDSKFPERSITLLVPYGAGGPTDQHLRVVADEAGKRLGRPIVIDNRAGANGTVAAGLLARAASDGYTLAVLPASVYREPFLNKVAFDPSSSFSYILMLSDYTFGVAVRADAPWKTWQDFVTDARKRPGQISMGGTGALATPLIVMGEAAEAAGISLNMVPYKGDGELATAILGGHLDAAPLSGVAVPYIDAGRMRYLAMATPKRIARFPDLPTLVELGLPVWIDSPYGIAAPKGLAPERLKTIHDAFKQALESPASLRTLQQLNQQINYLDPQAYQRYASQALVKEKTRMDKMRSQGLLP